MKRIIPFITFVLGVLLTFTVMTYVFPPEPVTVEKIIEIEVEPEIVYKDRVEYKEKIVYQERLTDLEQVVENVKGACVMVYAYMPDGSGLQSSGWIYNDYIVTVKHGVEGAKKVEVFFDNSDYSFPSDIRYIDEKLDVAVLSFKRNTPTVTLGDNETLRDGEKLISITSPQGAKNMIDECIYSGIQRTTTRTELNIAESAITGGSSGGAVFNYDSEIIGMVRGGGYKDAGAIPINLIKPILEKLK